MTNEPTITQVMKNTCMRISDESLKNCQFVSMTSLMLLSNSIEMRECRPLPGGGGHCLDIGESLGIWKGWRLHSTACTCSHVLQACMVPEHTPSCHCPNWVPLWPVLNLKPFSGDIIAQDLIVRMMTHKLWLGLESACMAIRLNVLSCHLFPNSPIFFNGLVFIRFSAILYPTDQKTS